jgi:putative spermidine/putrescine transport system substrate-binding protein
MDMAVMMRNLLKLLLCAALVSLGFSCKRPEPALELNLDSADWDQISTAARGRTVRMMMWDGDPLINAYMRDYVASQVKEQFDLQLEIIGGQGNVLVNKFMLELDAGRKVGDIDLVWINGETFYQLRQLKALYGPFTDKLPNNRYIDWKNPFIHTDFQQPVDGYECPWGNVQMAMIYDSSRVTTPPKNKEELLEWVKQNPGRFTFDNGFTGMTFLKSLLYEFAGGRDSLNGPFDEAKYQAASEKLWAYIQQLKPYLWKKGETFPEGVAQLHQLLMNGEVDFSMSNNDGEVDNKAKQGVLPETARAYVLESGTIRNSHYVGIPINAPNKEAALVLANFLISPEAQFKKATPEVWGDGTVLALDKLEPEWKSKFESVPGRERVAPRPELELKALLEPAPEIMIRLHEDFRKRIIESK